MGGVNKKLEKNPENQDNDDLEGNKIILIKQTSIKLIFILF